jgi:hypothetical protein
MAVTIDGTANTVTPLNGALGATTPSTVVATTVTDSTGTLRPLVSATAQASTSGTSIDFTGIPSWVKRITVMFSGVSTSGTSNIQIQIGAGSVQTTGYTGGAWTADASDAISTTGVLVTGRMAAANTMDGNASMVLLNSATGLWSVSSTLSGAVNATNSVGAGAKTLSGTLDRVRITTVNGTDTFDAGSINIMYE